MKKVFVTGGSGFIGKKTIQHLTRYFDTLLVPSHLELDLLNHDVVTEYMEREKPTHLLHLAWVTEHGKYWESVLNQDWLNSGKFLLEVFYRMGGIRAVVAGTCAEYDWSQKNFEENHLNLNPSTRYGRAKNELRSFLEKIVLNSNQSWSWGRVFFLYGPEENEKRLIPDVVRALLEGRKAQTTSAEQMRDFMFIDDCARAFVEILFSDVQGAVNIGSGESVTIKTIIQKIASKLGKTHLLETGVLENRFNDPDEISSQCGRLYHEVNFRSEYTLDQGIDETITYWRAILKK